MQEYKWPIALMVAAGFVAAAIAAVAGEEGVAGTLAAVAGAIGILFLFRT